MSQLPLLIIGANGKTGACVNRLLAERGIATRAASRSSTNRLDRTLPQTWGPALKGVSKAYVTYQPDLAVAGSADAVGRLSRIARESGVERFVLLSCRVESGAQRAEAALQASGVPWTIVRASWFCQNFSEGHLVDGVFAAELALPAGAVREPFIDARDIADVVTAALTNGQHKNKFYDQSSTTI